MTKLIMLLSILLAGFLLYKLNQYLKDRYNAGLFDWKSFWIVVGSLALTITIYLFYVADSYPAGAALSTRIANAKAAHYDKVRTTLDEEYRKYRNDPTYLRSGGQSLAAVLGVNQAVGGQHTLDQDEFEKKYAKTILEKRNLTEDLPQSVIDKITQDYQIAKQQKTKTTRAWILPPIMLAVFLGGIILLIWHNYTLIPNLWLAIPISLLKYVWTLLLVCGLFIILYLIGSVLGTRQERKRHYEDRLDGNTRFR
jgi:hypothetical protein